MTRAEMLARLEELEGELEELWEYLRRAGAREAVRQDIFSAAHCLFAAKRKLLAEVV